MSNNFMRVVFGALLASGTSTAVSAQQEASLPPISTRSSAAGVTLDKAKDLEKFDVRLGKRDKNDAAVVPNLSEKSPADANEKPGLAAPTN